MRKYLLLISVVCATLSVHSQDNQSTPDKQLAAIQEVINNTYSEKMEKILEADPPRYNQMKEELEAIDKMNDFQSKKKSADEYAKAHKDYYEDAMKKAAISIDAIMANLKTQFPDYSFSSPDGISILIERRTIAPIIPLVGTGKEDPKVAVVTTTSQQLSFAQRQSINCGLAAGGSVSFGTNSINVYSTAAVAGGCSSLGALANNTTIPTTPAQSISLRLNFNIHVTGFALSILGFSAGATSFAFITGGFPDGSLYVFVDGANRAVDAPFCWYASFDESESFTRTIDLTTFGGRTFEIQARANTMALSAGVSGTSSSSSINITNAELVTTTVTK